MSGTRNMTGQRGDGKGMALPVKKKFSFEIGDMLYIRCHQEGLGTKLHEFELIEKTDTLFRVSRMSISNEAIRECFLISDYENGLLEIKKMEEILNAES